MSGNPKTLVLVPATAVDTIKKFLTYSLDPVRFDYDRLTKAEQNLCTREDFDILVNWVLSP